MSHKWFEYISCYFQNRPSISGRKCCSAPPQREGWLCHCSPDKLIRKMLAMRFILMLRIDWWITYQQLKSPFISLKVSFVLQANCTIDSFCGVMSNNMNNNNLKANKKRWGKTSVYTLSHLVNDHDVSAWYIITCLLNSKCNFCVFSHAQKGIPGSGSGNLPVQKIELKHFFLQPKCSTTKQKNFRNP